ncbi:unnamed protein product [Orchesella dallaii]|uniref:Uncharacterized protein n=1 Tax=Orchesella dallaii TaxID=48710 RepID=A0ABP1RDQ7_9HEXA
MTTSPLHSQTEDKLANFSNIEHEKTTPVSCTDAQRQSGFPCQIRSTTYLVERTSEDESKSQTDSVKRVRIKDRPIPSKSTTAIKTKPKAGIKSSGLHTCPGKHDKTQNPTLDSPTITLSKKNLKRRQNSYLPILTKINLARLKKANLLDSPYLQGLKNFDSNIGDGNKPNKTVDPYTKTTFLENTAYNLARRASRAQSAGALENCMSSVHAQWGRVLSAISGSMNTRDKGYNGSRTCSGLANENPYTMSEVDRVKAQYKNFLSQTNKTEPRTISSFKPQTPNSAEKICPVVDETLQNSRLKERNGSKSTTKLNINVETERKPKTPGENAQTDPVKNIRPSSRIHNQSRAQTKMAKKVRNICYQCDRSKYWSNEIRNYYEWNAFCLLRKYRNNTQKVGNKV